MVQILTRHGARTPLHQSPLYPHVWQCNNTELFSIDIKSPHLHKKTNLQNKLLNNDEVKGEDEKDEEKGDDDDEKEESHKEEEENEFEKKKIHENEFEEKKFHKNAKTLEFHENNLFDDKIKKHPLRISVSQSKSVFLGDCHFSQLLGRGAKNLRKLGSHIRKIYVDEMKFLPKKFKQSIFKFRSTRTHRTIHSQMNFISGLYPNLETNQNITIFITDKEIDPLRHLPSICTNLKKVVEEVQESPEFARIGENSEIVKNTTIYKKLGKIFGTKGKSTNDIAMAARCNDLRGTLPDDVTDELLDSAALLKAAQQKYIYTHPKVFPLKFSFAIAEIVNSMIDRMNGKSNIRFIHWSAHDGDIFGFLGYLGTGTDTLPPYGSYIITELWKYRKNGEFFVRFIYNGKVLRIPRFGNVKEVLFDDFLRFVKLNMPKLKEDCGFTPEKLKKSWVFIPEEI